MEDSRLSESCLAWARNGKLGLLTLSDGGGATVGQCEPAQSESEPRTKSEFAKSSPTRTGRVPRGMERIFRAMNCSKAQKLAYATYMLVTEAENWGKEMKFLKLEQGNMSVGEYAAKFEELARFCPYSELEVDGRSKCSKFVSGLRPKLKMMFTHQEIVDFATLVNKCRMYENDLKVDELATLETLSPRNYGLQRNHMRERGKEIVEDDRKPYTTPTGHRDRNFQGSRPPTFPTGRVSTPLCNKCGGLHHGSTCPGSDNKCFYCKELGHIKRYFPKLSRRMNVVHAERARVHGREVTPKGAGTSGVDDPARGKSHGDKYPF
ncbi:hypothetical protein Lal_00021967 [Lupinus albus]|nr:hypothetical protein Lal_00021967 [Lupinus albus]